MGHSIHKGAVNASQVSVQSGIAQHNKLEHVEAAASVVAATASVRLPSCITVDGSCSSGAAGCCSSGAAGSSAAESTATTTAIAAVLEFFLRDFRGAAVADAAACAVPAPVAAAAAATVATAAAGSGPDAAVVTVAAVCGPGAADATAAGGVSCSSAATVLDFLFFGGGSTRSAINSSGESAK